MRSAREVLQLSVLVAAVSVISAANTWAFSYIRGGYMGQKSFALLERMAQTHMSAAIVKFGNVAIPLGSPDAGDLQKNASECARLGLGFMPVINWWGDNEPRWIVSYEHFVTAAGTVLPRTPCPYSEGLWTTYVTPRLLSIIEALGKLPLAALCLDTEMYGGDFLVYDQDCFCDRCFARYLAAKHRNATLPPVAERARIVSNAGDLESYRSVQRDEARQLAAACREAVAKARPNLRLGVLHLDLPFPLYEGMALGFGTGSLPVYAFTEHTYTEGFSPYISATQGRLRSLGASVDLVVGIFQSKFAPENLAEQLFRCAQASAGFWIYTMDTFANLNYQPLAGTPQQYWTAIENAAHELDRLAGNRAYVSSLVTQQRAVALPAMPWGGFVHYDLAPANKKSSGPMPEQWLRKTNWVYFWAAKGDAIAFELTWRQLGHYEDVGSVGVVSPQGEPLAAAGVRPNAPGVIHLTGPESGVYGLLLQAGMNAAEITHASHPYAVQIPATGDGAFLAVKIPRLFILFQPGAARASLELATPGATQAVRAEVKTENGSAVWAGVIDGPTRIAVDHPSGPYLVLTVEKLQGRVMQDLHVKALEGLVPLAAPDPAGLLQPGGSKALQ
jgi:hypothetical protein